MSRVAIFLLCCSLIYTVAGDPSPKFDFGATGHIESADELVFHACRIPGGSVGQEGVDNEDWNMCRVQPNMLVGEVEVDMTYWPILDGLGMAALRLRFPPCGQLTPHSHSRGTELCLVLKGELESGVYDTNNNLYRNKLQEGDITVFPMGLTHWIQNFGTKNATVFCYKNSGNPGYNSFADQLLSSDMPSVVLQSAFGMSRERVQVMRDILPDSEFRLPDGGCVPGADPDTEAN